MKRLLPVIAIALLSLTACKGSSSSVTPTVSPTPTSSVSPGANASPAANVSPTPTPTLAPTPSPTPVPTPTPTPVPTPMPTLNVVANGLNGTYEGQVIPDRASPGEAILTFSQTGYIFTGKFSFSIPGHPISGVISGTQINNVINGTLTPDNSSDCIMNFSNTSWITNTTANSALFTAHFSTGFLNCPGTDGGNIKVAINQPLGS